MAHQGIIQIKIIGRLGNQLHQYCAARAYAERIGAKLEVPDWAGRYIFKDMNEPTWSCELPEANDGGSAGGPTVEDGQTNLRIGGYFQMQRWVSMMSRAKLKQWLQVRPELLAMIGPRPMPYYVAAHLREGDYIGHLLFCNVTEASYRKALATFGLPERAVVWVRESQPRSHFGIDPNYSYLPDWVTIMRADVILRANSSFSWWAAALSDADIYAPVVEDHVGPYDAEFVQGNWPRCADARRVGTAVDDLHLPD